MQSKGIIDLLDQNVADLDTISSEIDKLGCNNLRGYIAAGKKWKIIRDYKLWSQCPYAHSFREYHEKEKMISHKTVNDQIKVSDLFGGLVDAMPSVPPVEISRLTRIISIVQKQGNAEDWLHRAIQLNKRDFGNFIREARNKIPTDRCEHPPQKQERWIRCIECNGWRKVSDKDLFSIEGHDSVKCGCTYLGFNAYSCGHVDEEKESAGENE